MLLRKVEVMGRFQRYRHFGAQRLGMSDVLLTNLASIFLVEQPENSQAASIAGDERHSEVLFDALLGQPFVFFVSVRRKFGGIVSQIGFFGLENASSTGCRDFDI